MRTLGYARLPDARVSNQDDLYVPDVQPRESSLRHQARRHNTDLEEIVEVAALGHITTGDL